MCAVWGETWNGGAAGSPRRPACSPEGSDGRDFHLTDIIFGFPTVKRRQFMLPAGRTVQVCRRRLRGEARTFTVLHQVTEASSTVASSTLICQKSLGSRLSCFSRPFIARDGLAICLKAGARLHGGSSRDGAPRTATSEKQTPTFRLLPRCELDRSIRPIRRVPRPSVADNDRGHMPDADRAAVRTSTGSGPGSDK